MKFKALTIVSLLSFSLSAQANPVSWMDWFTSVKESIETLSGVGKGKDPELVERPQSSGTVQPLSGVGKGKDPV